MIHLPRVMLAAPASGSGKTMITCGILQALKDRGLGPVSFKCGPDYIDPMFHSRVIGAKARNLDTFFSDERTVRYLFARSASGISVFEGVMGIYDGLGGTSAKASSYDLAAATDTPVILVINARGMSLSVIPQILGYVDYQRRLGKEVIRGVILNQTTQMTCLLLKEQIEAQTGIRVYGYVPRLADCVVESRHLGLVTPDEIRDLRQRMERLARELEKSLDMEGILALAEAAEDYRDEERVMPEEAAGLCAKGGTGADPETAGSCAKGRTGADLETAGSCAKGGTGASPKVRIAVARDEAFCFYYQDNLDLLEMLGAQIVPFSPLRDASLPRDIGGLLLGGGYPELYAKGLSENRAMREQIRETIKKGIPYLAECGGFMYLHEAMEDMEGTAWPMCGCIAGRAYRTPRLSRFGYITLENARPRGDPAGDRTEDAPGLLLAHGRTIRGHEFHYFDSTDPGESCTARKPAGSRTWNCIHETDRSMAGFPHLYYWSNPEFAYRFVCRAAKWTLRRKVCGQSS